MLVYRGSLLPIYGDCVAFRGGDPDLLVRKGDGEPAMRLAQNASGTVARVGFDLFGEVAKLLGEGQPAANAAIPALDLHIALLRELIVRSGIQLLEVPPIPEGFRLIACLTHDVDHPSIRLHRWDHTAFGFLFRAVVATTAEFLRGKTSGHRLIANLVAALKLPFVYLGLAKDFWRPFGERYRAIEGTTGSTYFIIPFRDRPGRTRQGNAQKLRASGYGAREIGKAVKALAAAGSEVALHGIDAWIDEAAGREELAEIANLAGGCCIGVRMHWLYSDRSTARALESAGAEYDSTAGYRETVGYRNGTSQVYKPIEADTLLELPLHVMDTALFYPGFMGLSSRQAATLLKGMVKNAARMGGCLTINWHDRSLAPERLWTEPYSSAVEELKNEGAWFATAGHAVGWFRKRRSVVFEEDDGGALRVRLEDRAATALPGLRLRVHQRGEGSGNDANPVAEYVDLPLREDTEIAAVVTTRA